MTLRRSPVAAPAAAASAAAAVLLAMVVPAHAGSDPARVSRYTRLDTCREITPAKGEGMSDWTCVGQAGFAVALAEADLRQELYITPPRAAKTALQLIQIDGNGGFSRIGDTIEWRGTLQAGRFRPDALIVRYNVVEDPNKPSTETSYLMAVTLARRAPCVIAKVAPSPDQNERARRVADAGGACLPINE